jgi:hypothetical protein
MKLLGKTDGDKFIASLHRYHCVTHGEMMVDGGQFLTNFYGGYNRFSLEGETVWFEVNADFAEIYNKYNKRQINGIWDVKQGRILPLEEYPHCDFFKEKVSNCIWGTYGKDGKSPLKYVLLKNCETDHLQNILKNVKHIQFDTKKVIEYILKNREA